MVPNINEILYGKPKHKRQPVSSSQKKTVLLKQGGRCANPKCKRILTASVHYDHIKEVSRGGKSTTSNLRAFCASCHQERHILDKAKEMDKKNKRNNGNKNPLGLGSIKIGGFKF